MSSEICPCDSNGLCTCGINYYGDKCEKCEKGFYDSDGNNSDTKPKRSVSERNDELVGEEEEVRFLPEQEHSWKTNLDSSNVSSGCSGQTGVTSLPSEGDDICSDKDKKAPSNRLFQINACKIRFS